MNKESWNNEKLGFIDSDEFKYLDNIDNLINQTTQLTEAFRVIKQIETQRIQKNKKKDIFDFSEIESKLNEVQNMMAEL